MGTRYYLVSFDEALKAVRVSLLWKIGLVGAVVGVVAGVGLLSAFRGAAGEAITEKPSPHAITPELPRVSMVTLFWPPYTGEDLPYGGESTKIIRSVFESAGYQVDVGFVPWPRALSMFDQSQADIIYPEYPERSAKDGCLQSMAYQETALALLERRDTPIRWETLEDLRRYTLGVVRGYLNSPDVDARIADGCLTVEEDNSDAGNIRKVAVGRIAGAFIDPEVFSHLMEQEISLLPLRDLLQINPKIIAPRTLHACFHDTERGRALLALFNQAIKERQTQD